MNSVRCRWSRGVEARELGAGEERLEFLDDHFDVVKANLSEDVEFDVLSDGFRVLEGPPQGLDAYFHRAPPGRRRPPPLLHWRRRVA